MSGLFIKHANRVGVQHLLCFGLNVTKKSPVFKIGDPGFEMNSYVNRDVAFVKPFEKIQYDAGIIVNGFRARMSATVFNAVYLPIYLPFL